MCCAAGSRCMCIAGESAVSTSCCQSFWSCVSVTGLIWCQVMSGASMQHVCGSQVLDHDSEAVCISPDHVLTGMMVRKDGNCGIDRSVADRNLKPDPTAQFCSAHRISTFPSKSVGQSLPSLPEQNCTLLSCSIQSSASLSCRDLSSQPLPTEIPSAVISAAVVADCGISTSHESCLLSSRMNVGMSDTETMEEVSVTFEPFCRICQLPSDIATSVDTSLISPCRCTGSLQYTHTACLVVSHISAIHVYETCTLQIELML